MGYTDTATGVALHSLWRYWGLAGKMHLNERGRGLLLGRSLLSRAFLFMQYPCQLQSQCELSLMY